MKEKRRVRVILASGSPRRREILEGLGVEYWVEVPGVEEIEDGGVEEVALGNARLKAGVVAERNVGEWVLAGDTVVGCEGKLYGKPRDREDAKRMLREYSGKVQEVVTGVVLENWGKGVRIERAVRTLVYFRELSEEVIDKYVREVEVMDKAGGYSIQDKGEILVERYEGSYTNIVGMPEECVRELMEVVFLEENG